MNIRFLFLVLLFITGSQVYSQDFSSERSKNIISENGQKYYIHHVVKGNTIYNISKTYGVSGNTILEYNPSISQGLSIGVDLKIPFEEKAPEDFIYHIVKQKETLYQISKIYNVKVEDILRINNLQNQEISIGQYLKIPSIYANTNSDVLNISATEVNTPQKVDENKYVVYNVQPKETLYNISKRYGISIDALMYLNDLSSPQISSGQVLLIPKKLLVKASNSEVDSSKYITHKVLPKETLYGIAKEYAVSTSVIIEKNELGGKQIQIGQILLIPRELNNTGFITHEVLEKKEKLSKIADDYQVSEAEIIQANPNASNKMKKGESVLIPVGFVETDYKTSQDQHMLDQIAAIDTTQEILESEDCKKLTKQSKKYHIALMIPLYLDEVDSLLVLGDDELLEKADSRPFKFIEFYEGALLAAQELNKQGLDFEIHVYDVPREDTETEKVLNDPQLQQMDIMISLLYSKSFDLVSDFSKKYHIPLVNAISKRRKIIYDNPYVYKVEPNEELLYQNVSNYILEKFPQYNIILVRSNAYQLANEYKNLRESLEKGISPNFYLRNEKIINKIESYKKEYPNLSKQFSYKSTAKLEENNPRFNFDEIKAFPNDTSIFKNSIQSVNYSQDSLTGLVAASSLFRNNLVVALGQEEVFAIELFTKLNFVRDSFNYQVIGLPYWTEYKSLDVEYTQPLGLQIVTSKFVDYTRPLVQNFVLNFREQYGIEPMSDRYAFLGYDVMKYFLSALKNYGTNFPSCLDHLQVDLLENHLEFLKVPNAGYENTTWKIIKQKNYKYHLVN